MYVIMHKNHVYIYDGVQKNPYKKKNCNVRRLGYDSGFPLCIFENDAIAEGSRKESECFQKYRNVGRWAEGGRKETSEGLDAVCVGRASIFSRFCSEFSCRFLCAMSHLHCIVDLHESGGHG